MNCDGTVMPTLVTPPVAAEVALPAGTQAEPVQVSVHPVDPEVVTGVPATHEPALVTQKHCDADGLAGSAAQVDDGQSDNVLPLPPPPPTICAWANPANKASIKGTVSAMFFILD